MKGFSTDDKGDVIVGKTIEMVGGNELLRQTIQRVIGTNHGEWEFDAEEGIDFRVLLCKNPDKDEIRNEIEQALERIDETLTLTDFALSMDGRNAVISFSATNGNGEDVGGEYTYAS